MTPSLGEEWQGGLAIRAVRDGDHEACAAVFLAAYRQAFPHHPADYYTPRLYFDSIAGEQQFVALMRDDIVAVLSIYWPENFIHSLYVLPALQGQGIGRRLLRSVLAQAKGACELKCDRGNRRAIGFYRHLGWREVGEGTAETGGWIRLRK